MNMLTYVLTVVYRIYSPLEMAIMVKSIYGAGPPLPSQLFATPRVWRCLGYVYCCIDESSWLSITESGQDLLYIYVQSTRYAETDGSGIPCIQHGGLTGPIYIILSNGINTSDAAETYDGSQTESFLESQQAS